MNKSATIGVDIGTTNAKVLLVDESGKVLVERFAEYPVEYPQPDWAEQDPEIWVRSARTLLNEVCEATPDGCQIGAIGISGQMHGLVTLGRDKQVLRPAILWNDQRSQPQCESILKAIGGTEKLLDLTNNRLLPGYTFPKLIWLKENEPAIFSEIAHILLPKDYVRFRLTGHLGTDYSDASGTGCFDVKHRKWAKAPIEQMEVPLEWFPNVHLSTEIVGEISGLPGPDMQIPVVAGSGDAVLQPLASGVTELDEALLVVGTGGNVTVKTEGFSRNEGGKVQFFCDVVGDQYVAMGVTLSAGESLRWLRNLLTDGLKAIVPESPDITFEDLAKLAEQSPACAGGVIFTPYLQGERCPYADPDLRASFTGMSSTSSLADLSRAVLEGVAFSLRDVSLVLKSIDIDINRYRLMGGGGKNSLWRTIFANVLNKPVSTHSTSLGGTAYGAALLAKLGTTSQGWNSEKSTQPLESDCHPTPALAQKYAAQFLAYQAVHQQTREL